VSIVNTDEIGAVKMNQVVIKPQWFFSSDLLESWAHWDSSVYIINSELVAS